MNTNEKYIRGLIAECQNSIDEMQADLIYDEAVKNSIADFLDRKAVTLEEIEYIFTQLEI